MNNQSDENLERAFHNAARLCFLRIEGRKLSELQDLAERDGKRTAQAMISTILSEVIREYGSRDILVVTSNIDYYQQARRGFVPG